MRRITAMNFDLELIFSVRVARESGIRGTPLHVF